MNAPVANDATDFSRRGIVMLDALYIAGTIGFFGLMLGYVSFCERLGQSEKAHDKAAEERP